MRSLYFTGILLFALSTFGQAQLSLTPKKFNRLAEKEGATIIDVRTAAEWRSGHIAGAKLENVGKKETFLANCAELAENGPVVFLVSSMEDCKQRFRNGKS